MDGSDTMVRRKSLKERLGFIGIGCCGATWKPRSGAPTLIDEDEDEEVVINMYPTNESTTEIECFGQTPGRSGMNLAAALAAERQFRAAQVSPIEGPSGPNSGGPGTPGRVSLMRLLEETDGGDDKEEMRVVVGNDLVCCVCMVRKKGSAFIPCGHTFCRVCSREVWVNRGTCPL